MTRYELTCRHGSGDSSRPHCGTLGGPLVVLVTVDSPEDRAALAHFRRAGWRCLWLRTRDARARVSRHFKLSASSLRRALELQALRELNAAASTPRPHTMRASGLRKARPEPDL